MTPPQLMPESFAAYPPEAKRLAGEHISLLRRLPLGFLPLLLRELIVYDWKFPAERQELDRQFKYLESLPAGQLSAAMGAFTRLRLTAALEKMDWAGSPGVFTEDLTAHLWATHQIDAFRAAAVDYVSTSNASQPEDPLPIHRMGVAIIGQGAATNEYKLFRKLRPYGAYFTDVTPSDGLNTILSAVAKRAADRPMAYGHWYIEGGMPARVPGGFTHLSYGGLAPVRSALQARMQKIYEASVFDPEAFRTRLAQTQPAEVGIDSSVNPILSRFQLSLLTEGSGTQVFSTTFVQWAAREAFRRAQPLTLVARFAPRQRENPMNELLGETRRPPELDPQGSLIDADMGAYYTWLNQQRLPGAANATFLAWFEDQREAVAIGPGLEPGKRSDGPVTLAELTARLAQTR